MRTFAIASILVLLLAGCSAPTEEPVEPASLQPQPLPTEPADLAASKRGEGRASAQPAPTGAPFVLAPAPDPLENGPFAFERSLYDFGERPFTKMGEAAYVIRLRGSIHIPDGPGPFPVVLFQHGRHGTCRLPVLGDVLAPGLARCPATPIFEPADSYVGYDYIAENLASHGFVVASVDTGDVNDLDASDPDAGAAARAFILLETLDELSGLTEGGGEGAMDLTGLLDLERIGLMGHSRGGEGVTFAISENAARPEGERHALRAVFALAPIDRTQVKVEGVAWATLLPYCDGDVTSLSGARFYDDSRDVEDGFPRSQLLVMGANHNYYNTRWENDDAGRFDSDPACGGTGRLSAEEQRAQGEAHIAAFFRLHLTSETLYAPLFDGRAGLPLSACPARLSCEDLVHVASTSSARLLVRGVPAQADATGARITKCAPPDCPGSYAAGSAARAVVEWDAPALLAFALQGPTDVGSFRALVMRVAFDAAADADRAPPAMRVVLVDASGANASIEAGAVSAALFLTPGGEGVRKVVLNDLRIPLEGFHGLDRGRVAGVRVELLGTGSMHLADVAFQP